MPSDISDYSVVYFSFLLEEATDDGHPGEHLAEMLLAVDEPHEQQQQHRAIGHGEPHVIDWQHHGGEQDVTLLTVIRAC